MFVFEFKMADGEDDWDADARQAIEQIREKGYAEQYRDRNEPVHMIGMAFVRDRSPAAVNLVPA